MDLVIVGQSEKFWRELHNRVTTDIDNTWYIFKSSRIVGVQLRYQSACLARTRPWVRCLPLLANNARSGSTRL